MITIPNMSPNVFEFPYYIRQGDSYMDYSIISQLDTKTSFGGLSIKHVLRGCENYTIYDKRYSIKQGEYLITNDRPIGRAEIDSDTPVHGVCIDLSRELIQSAVSSIICPATPFPDEELSSFISSEDFSVYHYQSCATTRLGKRLDKIGQNLLGAYQRPQLSSVLNTNGSESLNFRTRDDFFFSMAEIAALDCADMFSVFRSIKAVKHSTKRELLRRVNNGKMFIQEHYTQSIDIATVARESCLSEFHFYRLFRTAYGCSPHQYIIQLRINYAKQQLAHSTYSISDIAMRSGFSSIHSFSKSFREQTGVSPTQWRNSSESDVVDRNSLQLTSI
jgi:AraC family transcriptional regulator